MASVIWTSAPRSRREIWHLNSPAIDSYEKIVSQLSGKFGDTIAALFAVPSRQSDGSIHWTDRLGADETRSLRELTGDEKDRASATLREALQKIETACDASPDGQLVLGAINVEDADAIRVANGRPILAGWGAVPAGLTTPAELSAHHLATLGPLLSRIEPPRFWVQSVETIPLYGRLYGSRALLAAVLLAAIVLAWLLLPGVLKDNYITSALPETDFSESNRSIERQIETVKRSLDSNVCIATTLPRLETPLGRDALPRAGGTSVPPAGNATPVPPITGTPKGAGEPGAVPPAAKSGVPASPGDRSNVPGATTTPGDGAAPATPAPGATPDRSGQDQTTPAPERDQALAPPTPPVDPSTAPVPSQVAGPGSASMLATLLKKATVIIVTKEGLGTGFFVSPNHILTNRHVIENSQDQILIGNTTMARLLPADMVGASEKGRMGGPDYAVLKLRSGTSDAVLSFADTLPQQMDNVIATGYPGFVIREDESYRKMMSGDARSVPEAAFSNGGVTYIQNPASASPVILHYASISPGNSGGPLADECGRVVGVNTYVRSNEGANARMQYSLASASAIAFLKRFSVTPRIVAGRCTTAVAGNTPAPQSPPPAASPPAQAPAPDPGAAKSTKSTPPAAPGAAKK